MKQAKRHGGSHRCGNCARTVRIRHEPGKVACVAHLEIMPADHASDCEDFQPVAASNEAPSANAALPSV